MSSKHQQTGVATDKKGNEMHHFTQNETRKFPFSLSWLINTIKCTTVVDTADPTVDDDNQSDSEYEYEYEEIEVEVDEDYEEEIVSKTGKVLISEG